MARIAIDCDGVLADFVSAFIAELQKIEPGHPLKSAEQWTTWDGGVDHKLRNKVWKKIAETENWWLSLNAYNDVGDLARFLLETKGHDIWVTTARSKSSGMTPTKQTEIWLKTCNLYDGHNFLGVMTIPDPDEKARFYAAAEIEWSIDDKESTVAICNLMPDHQAYLLKRPWNSGNDMVVQTVGEFLRKIK